jgi:inosine-uridine nucleoside N-ribohydrolase
LTNIAIALFRHENLRKYIRRIIIAGGSASYGDVTPFAERNVFEDAYACQAVLQSRIPVAMMSLGVAAQAKLSVPEFEGVFTAQTGKGDLRLALRDYHLKQSRQDAGVMLLDAAAALMLADPSPVRLDYFHAAVETASSVMYGRTLSDWRHYEPGPKETVVSTSLEKEDLLKALMEAVN